MHLHAINAGVLTSITVHLPGALLRSGLAQGCCHSAGAEAHLPLPLSPTRAMVDPAGTSRLKSLKIGSSGRVG